MRQGEVAVESPLARARHAAPGAGRLAAFADGHHAALLVIVVAFVGRLFLSGVNSYWLDEMFSIYVHATTPDTTAEVVDSMRGIIHPPLYQIVLFHWIQLFGDTEVATRSLSNVFVAIASGFLYLLAWRVYGRRIALVCLLLFSLMHAPIYYALETRSYAMVIMWAAASSWLLHGLLRDMPLLQGWRRFLVDGRVIALTAVNTAALFTHYYMAFFVAAQGLFLLLVLLYRHDGWRRPGALLRLAVLGAVPPAILLLLWGDSMAQRYAQGGRFAVESPALGLLATFREYVIAPNVDPANVAAAIVFVAALVHVARALRAIAARKAVLRPYVTLYVAFWLCVPIALAFTVLMLAGQDAYYPRYFVFSSPAIALLLGVGLFELARLASRVVGGRTGSGQMRQVYRFSAVLGVVLAVATVLPKGYAGATAAKDDWRLVARLVADTIHADPDHRYIIYDTGYRADPMIDYYLERSAGDLRVHGIVTQPDEDADRLPFEADRDEIARHDYLVLIFTHLEVATFGNTFRALDRDYREQYRVLLSGNTGYVVYRL